MTPRLKLRLRRPAETAVKKGHPWVYESGVASQNRDGATGELAVIYDARDTFLAVGLYDADSPIRVRVLHAGKPVQIDAALWAARLDQTINSRQHLFDESTTGWRWINGENDGWPGLIIDNYAGALVLKIYTAAWLPWLDELVRLFESSLEPKAIILRLSRNIQTIASQRGGFTEGFLRGESQNPVIFQEHGILFASDVLRGQKTGFYLDQRENRQRVRAMARGKSVLNAFSYSGGFSLNAAKGGATLVTDLDISPHALAEANGNFQRNAADPGIARAQHRSVQADAFEWLAQSGERFDLIVLDPPSLARREEERSRASAAYERLAASAIARLKPSGTLVSSSCSAHVSREEFLQAVNRAAARSGRRSNELWTSGHAADHPVTVPELEYLKCIALQFEVPR